MKTAISVAVKKDGAFVGASREFAAIQHLLFASLIIRLLRAFEVCGA